MLLGHSNSSWYPNCPPCRVALRLVATGVAPRVMELLVRHADIAEAAGQPLPPADVQANVQRCSSLLSAASECLRIQLEDAAAIGAPGGAAADGNSAMGPAMMQCSTAAMALIVRGAVLRQQGYPLSQLKALLEREMPPFVEAVAACHTALQPEGAAPEGSTAGSGQWPTLADPPSQQQLLAVAAALAARPGCGNLRCTNCTGADERGMPKGRRCSGCRTVRFCSAACQREAWPQHRVACRLLAAAQPAGG